MFAEARIVELDNGFEFSTEADVGERIVLDCPVPLEKGYRIVGAAFDPIILRLDGHIRESGEEEHPRVRYSFTALEAGRTDVLVKMEPVSGGNPEVYRRVGVTVR